MSDTTYAGYLALDELLACQKPLSNEHDETVFITTHQTMELWLKQILTELDLAQSLIRKGNLIPAYKSLARISRIQEVMTLSWEVLATMTPADYTSFRDRLGTSSGFQSDQFRTLEFRLGLKDEGFLRFQADRPEARARLEASLSAPTVYDDTLGQLAAHGLLAREALRSDVSQPYEPSAEVEDAWLKVYTDTARWWDLYQLAEKLVDLDDALQTWRHKHVVTVERIIGGKRGTGGTEGVSYLRTTLNRRCFPELWTVRTRL
jgi:tryptophan 2,3-dioxygenase